MVGAAIAVWFGYRGVFGAAALIYAGIVVLAVAVGRNATARGEGGQAAVVVGD